MSQLKFYNTNTSQWEPAIVGATGPTGPTGPAGGGAEDLDELTDVALTNPQDGDILVYNASTSSWVNLHVVDGGTP